MAHKPHIVEEYKSNSVKTFLKMGHKRGVYLGRKKIGKLCCIYSQWWRNKEVKRIKHLLEMANTRGMHLDRGLDQRLYIDRDIIHM